MTRVTTFFQLSGQQRQNQIERAIRLRLNDDLPPVYPNGWFCIAESSDVHTREIKPVIIFGMNE